MTPSSAPSSHSLLQCLSSVGVSAPLSGALASIPFTTLLLLPLRLDRSHPRLPVRRFHSHLTTSTSVFTFQLGLELEICHVGFTLPLDKLEKLMPMLVFFAMEQIFVFRETCMTSSLALVTRNGALGTNFGFR